MGPGPFHPRWLIRPFHMRLLNRFKKIHDTISRGKVNAGLRKASRFQYSFCMQRAMWLGILIAYGVLLAAGSGCASRAALLRTLPPERRGRYEVVEMEVTAYCPCGKCTGWHRNWLFQPVYSSGPMRGKRKAVGITSSGSLARPGTLAADTSLFPYGTIMYVPGYGYGRVEDTGADIKGHRLDVFFPRHHQAEAWGRVRVPVKVWRP